MESSRRDRRLWGYVREPGRRMRVERLVWAVALGATFGLLSRSFAADRRENFSVTFQVPSECDATLRGQSSPEERAALAERVRSLMGQEVRVTLLLVGGGSGHQLAEYLLKGVVWEPVKGGGRQMILEVGRYVPTKRAYRLIKIPLARVVSIEPAKAEKLALKTAASAVLFQPDGEDDFFSVDPDSTVPSLQELEVLKGKMHQWLQGRDGGSAAEELSGTLNPAQRHNARVLERNTLTLQNLVQREYLTKLFSHVAGEGFLAAAFQEFKKGHVFFADQMTDNAGSADWILSLEQQRRLHGKVFRAYPQDPAIAASHFLPPPGSAAPELLGRLAVKELELLRACETIDDVIRVATWVKYMVLALQGGFDLNTRVSRAVFAKVLLNGLYLIANHHPEEELSMNAFHLFQAFPDAWWPRPDDFEPFRISYPEGRRSFADDPDGGNSDDLTLIENENGVFVRPSDYGYNPVISESMKDFYIYRMSKDALNFVRRFQKEIMFLGDESMWPLKEMPPPHSPSDGGIRFWPAERVLEILKDPQYDAPYWIGSTELFETLLGSISVRKLRLDADFVAEAGAWRRFFQQKGFLIRPEPR